MDRSLERKQYKADKEVIYDAANDHQLNAYGGLMAMQRKCCGKALGSSQG
jgi:hypothetical protein